MKNYLDKLQEKYETVDFIKDDPIQFPHLFKDDIKNLEIMAFISSIFAFGKREAFIQKLNYLLKIMNNNPYEFILKISDNEEKLNGFLYRFYKPDDILMLFYILFDLFKSGKTIGDLFYENRDIDVCQIFQGVYNYFHSSKFYKEATGFSFMISNPNNLGANKRMNMFLRWMVRKGPVDFGVWDFIETKDLIIPLDVHCANVSRSLSLLKRKQNNFKSAWELTQKLKEFDALDPVKYDFALFGAGVNKDNLQVLYK